MTRSKGSARVKQHQLRGKALEKFKRGFTLLNKREPTKEEYNLIKSGFNMGYKTAKTGYVNLPKYTRIEVYSLYEILSKVIFLPKKPIFLNGIKLPSGKDYKVNFNGYMMNMASDRLKLFFNNHTCVKCGIEGKFFAMESNGNDNPHFNLYAIDNGKEILMTKDHIIPKSMGGKDKMDNYQTMCIRCNMEKGNDT